MNIIRINPINNGREFFGVEKKYIARGVNAPPQTIMPSHQSFFDGKYTGYTSAVFSESISWQLPFPPQDPLIEARRREAQEQGLDPVTAVDYPEMGLRLKQGCGRLIRTRENRGAIAILKPVLGTPWEQTVLGALPAGAKVVRSLEALSTLRPRTFDHAHLVRTAADVTLHN